MKREALKVKEKYKSELNFIKPTAGNLMEKKLRWGVEAENTGWKKRRPKYNTSCSLRLIH